MSQAVSWEQRDWERLAQSGYDLVVHAALRRAIAFDLDATESLLAFCQSSAGRDLLPEGLSAAHVHVELRLAGTNEGDPPETYDVEKFCLAQAPALALQRAVDPERHSSTMLNRWDIDTFFKAEDVPLAHPWTPQADRVVRAAISTWEDDEESLRAFFLACCRFVQHPGFMKCFVESGVDMHAFLDQAQQEALYQNDEFKGQTGIQILTRQGSLLALADWLETVDFSRSPGFGDDLTKLFKALAGERNNKDWDHTTAAVHVATGSLIDWEERNRAEQDEPPLMNRVGHRVGEGLVQLLKQTGRDRAGFPLDRAWCLKRRLTEADDMGRAPNLEMVDAILDVLPRDGVTLRQALAQQPPYKGEVQRDGWHLHIESPEEVQNKAVHKAMRELLMAAAATHCAPVIAAAADVIRESPPWHGALIKALAMAGDEKTCRRKHPFDRENFEATLQALEAAGVDVRGPFHDEWREKPSQSTFLHALAESKRSDSYEVLDIALDHGFDPMARNGRSWTAVASVADKDMRQKWLSVMARHEARKAADALFKNDLGLQL